MDTKLIDKYYTYLLWLFIVPVVWAIIHLGLLTWPWADDFSYMNQVLSTENVIEYIKNQYVSWEGRFLSFPFFYVLLRKVEYTNLVVAVMCTCFLGSVFLSARLWQKIFNPDKKHINPYLLLAMLCTFWIGLRPILAQTLYWATGGIQYMIPLLGSLVWLNVIYYVLFERERILHKWFWFIALSVFSFLLGGGNQTLTPALVVIALGLMFLPTDRPARNKGIVLVSLVFMGAAAIIMYLSPGAMERASRGKDLGVASFVFSPVVLLGNFGKVCMKYTAACWVILPLSFLGAFFSALFFGFDKTEIGLRGYMQRYQKRLNFSAIFLIGAVASILPFALVPVFTPLRASIYYNVFLGISIWCVVGYNVPIFVFIASRMERIISKYIMYIFPVILCFVFLFMVSDDIHYGKQIRTLMVKRNKILSSVSEKVRGTMDMNVEPVRSLVPVTLRFDEMSEKDRDWWMNKDIAAYYGFNSVAVENKYQYDKSRKERRKMFEGYDFYH